MRFFMESSGLVAQEGQAERQCGTTGWGACSRRLPPGPAQRAVRSVGLGGMPPKQAARTPHATIRLI